MSESLAAATSGGERRALDYYPTPLLACLAIVPLVADFPEPIWEPHCGDGGLADVLKLAGRRVVASDLVDRSYEAQDATGDLLAMDHRLGPSVVGNPPFDDAESHVWKLYELGIRHCALVLKADFWNAGCRGDLFRTWKPDAVLAYSWRLDFTGAGRPHRNMILCIWRPGTISTSYDILPKPMQI